MKTFKVISFLAILLSFGCIAQQLSATPLDDLYNTIYNRIPGSITNGPIQNVITTETAAMAANIEARQELEQKIAAATQNVIGKQKAQLLIKQIWSWLSKKCGSYTPDLDDIRPHEDISATLKTLSRNEKIHELLKKQQGFQQKINVNYDIINGFESFKQSNSELYNFIYNNKKTLNNIIGQGGYRTPHEEKIARMFIELAQDQNNRLVKDIGNALEQNISLEELHKKYPDLKLDNTQTIDTLSNQLGVYESWYMKPVNFLKKHICTPARQLSYTYLGKTWGSFYQEHPDATVAVTTAATMACAALLVYYGYRTYKWFKRAPAQPAQPVQQQQPQAQQANGNNQGNGGINVNVVVNNPANNPPAAAAPAPVVQPNNQISLWQRLARHTATALKKIVPPLALAAPLIGAISYSVGK